MTISQYENQCRKLADFEKNLLFTKNTKEEVNTLLTLLIMEMQLLDKVAGEQKDSDFDAKFQSVREAIFKTITKITQTVDKLNCYGTYQKK